MKCDNCGKNFAGTPVFETHEVTEGLIGRAKSYIRNTTTEPITLCPECAARRRNLPTFILTALCIAAGVVAIICLLLR